MSNEMNCTMLEKIRYLSSNASLSKMSCVEALVYASHLMNYLSSTVIEGKTLLDI